MAYYFKRGARYDNIFQFSLIQEYGALAYDLREMLYQDELLQKKLLKMQDGYKIGDLLYEYSKQRNCWSMAFVLDDVASNWSDFHLAVLSENLKKIHSILDADPDLVNKRDTKGRTPLALAACYQCNESLKILLTFDPDINSEDEEGYTPLMRAAEYGNADMVKSLLANGAKLTSNSYPNCAIALQISSKTKNIADSLQHSYISHRIDSVEAPFFETIADIQKSCAMIENAAEICSLQICADQTSY
jgi:hypothetical protein